VCGVEGERIYKPIDRVVDVLLGNLWLLGPLVVRQRLEVRDPPLMPRASVRTVNLRRLLNVLDHLRKLRGVERLVDLYALPFGQV
jgi:hypothetical protein